RTAPPLGCTSSGNEIVASGEFGTTPMNSFQNPRWGAALLSAGGLLALATNHFFVLTSNHIHPKLIWLGAFFFVVGLGYAVAPSSMHARKSGPDSWWSIAYGVLLVLAGFVLAEYL